MSEVIDEKVVRMRFDNHQFEQGVSQSVSSLEKLKKSLNMEQASKGLASFNDAAARLGVGKIDEMTSSTNNLSNAFNFFVNQVAIGGIRKIGDEITGKILGTLNKVISTVKSLSFDQITAGFEKFSDKTVSVATLIAQGFDIDTVSEQLERLNWFTDETSYNFTEMVNNIGKFTAAGQKLDDSVTAMEGIATWAALSGQNASTASRAMYQISQAMGSGLMRKEDWKSIQTANMATKEFEETAIEAAIALKRLKDNGNGTYTSLMGKATFTQAQFAEGLTEGRWFDQEVMMETFKRYSSAVGELYDITAETGMTASEAINEIGESLDQFGLKAFKAAQEARTFGDVLDSVKDAVSTGWMNTFEAVIGNEEESVKLFTWMANALYDVFAESGNKRNEILAIWKDTGGRTELLEGLYNIIVAINSVLTPIKDAFHDIFDTIKEDDFNPQLRRGVEIMSAYEKYITALGEKLKETTTKFKEFTEKLIANSKTMAKIKATALGLFSIFDIIKDTIWELIKGIFSLDDEAGGILDTILSFTAYLGFLLTKLRKFIKESGIVKTLVKSLTIVFKSLLIIFGSVLNLIANLAGSSGPMKGLEIVLTGAANLSIKLANAIVLLTNKLLIFANKIRTAIPNFTKTIIKGFGDVLNTFKAIGAYITEGFSIGLMEGFGRIFNTVVALFSRVITLVCQIFGIHSPSVIFQQIGYYIVEGFRLGLSLIDKLVIKPFLSVLLFFSSAVESVFKGLFGSGSVIGNLISNFNKSFVKLLGVERYVKVVAVFTRIKNVLKEMIGNLKEYIVGLDKATIKSIVLFASLMAGIIAVYKLINSFTAVNKSLSGLLDTVNGVFKKIKEGMTLKNLDALTSPLLKLTVLIGVLTASLIALTYVYKHDKESLLGATNLLMGMLLTLYSLTLLFEWAGNKIAGIIPVSTKFALAFSTMAKSLMKVGIFLIEIAAAMFILSSAIKQLDGVVVDPNTIFGLTLLTITLGVVCAALAKYAPVLSKGALTILSIAGAMLMLSNSMNVLSQIPSEKVGDVIWSFLALAAGLGAVCFAIQHISFGGIFALIIVATAFGILLPILKEVFVDGGPTQTILASIATVAGIITLLVGFYKCATFMAKIGGALNAFNKGLLMLTGSVALLGAVVYALGSLEGPSIARGLLGVVGISAILTGLIVLMVILGNTVKFTKGAKTKLLYLLGVLEIFTLVAGSIAGLAILMSIVPLGGLAKAVVALGAVSACLAVLQWTAKNTKGIKATVILALFGAIVLAGLMLVAISYIPWDKILPAAGSFALVLLAMGAVFQAAGNLVKRGAKYFGVVVVLFTLIGAMTMLAEELYSLAKLVEEIGYGNAAIAFFGLAAVIYAFAAVLRAIATIKPNPQVIANLGATIGPIIAISAGLFALSFMPWSSVVTAFGAMSLTFIAFAAAIDIISKAKPKPELLANLLPTAVIIGAIGASLFAISFLPWYQIGASMLAMSVTLGAFGICLSIIAGAKPTPATLAKLLPASVMIGAIGASLFTISFLPWNQVLTAMVAMSATMLALGGMFRIVGGIKINLGNWITLLSVSGVILAVGGALTMVATQPWQQIAATIGLVAVTLAGMAGIMLVLGSSLAPALPAIYAFVGVMGALAIGLVYVAKSIQTFAASAVLLNGIDFTFLANGIVALATSLLSLQTANVSTVTESLSKMIPEITAFASQIKMASSAVGDGFAEGLASMPEAARQSTADTIKAITDGITPNLAQVATAGLILGAMFVLGYRSGLQWHSPPVWAVDSMDDTGTAIVKNAHLQEDSVRTAGANLGKAIVGGFESFSPSKIITEEQIKANAAIIKTGSDGLQADYQTGQAMAGQVNDGFKSENIPGVVRTEIEKANKEVAESSIDASEGQTEAAEKEAEALALIEKQMVKVNAGVAGSARELGIWAYAWKDAGYISEQTAIDLSNQLAETLSPEQFEEFTEGFKSTQEEWQRTAQETEKIAAGSSSDIENLIGTGLSKMGEGGTKFLSNYSTLFTEITGQAGIAGADAGNAYGSNFYSESSDWMKELERDQARMKRENAEEQKRMFGYDVDVTSEYSSAYITELQKHKSKKEMEKWYKDAGYDKDGKKHIKGELEIDATTTSTDDASESLDGFAASEEGAAKSAKDLKKSIKDSIKIFQKYDDVTKNTTLTGNKLLGNMKSQMDMSKDWYMSMSSLKGKISEDFYNELVDQGTDSYETVIELMDMSSAQLYYADELYKRRSLDAAKYSDSLKSSLTEESNAYVMTEEQLKSYNDILEDYAMKIVDVEEGTDVTVEEVNAMANAILAANPQLAAMGKTTKDVSIDILALATDITTLADEIKDSLEGSLKYFDVYTREVSKTPRDLMKALLSQRAGMESYVEDMAQLATRGLSDSVLDELKDMGVAGADIVKGFVNMTDDQLKAYSKLFDDVKDSPEGLAKALAMAMNGAEVEFTNSIEGMTAEMVLLKFQIEDTIQSSMDAFSKFDTSSISIEEMSANLVSQLAGTADWTKSLGELAGKGINENLLKELEKAGPSSYKYVKALSKSSEKGLKEYNMLWEMYSADWSSILSEAYARGDTDTIEFANNFIEHFDDIENATFKTMESVKEELRSSIQSSIKMFQKYDDEFELTPEDALANVKSQVEGIKKWSSNLQSLAGKNISNEFLDYLTSLGPEGAETINAIVQMSASELAETDKYVQEALKLDETESQKIVDSYEKAGRNFNEGLLNGLDIQGTYSKFSELADSGLYAIYDTWDEHSPSKEAEKAGAFFNEGLGLGVLSGNAPKMMKLEADMILARAKSGLSDKQGRNIGKNLVAGLAAGIRENANIANNAASLMATNLLKQVKKIFGIHSPSKEFEQIGRRDCEGLGEGISKYAKIVYDSAEKMANETINGFGDTFSSITDIIDWDDLNPVITPTMDLTNIVDGIRNINDMFNQNESIKLNGNLSNAANSLAAKAGTTFIQNNYSPKELSRVEIYRQTKNLISTARGAYA